MRTCVETPALSSLISMWVACGGAPTSCAYALLAEDLEAPREEDRAEGDEETGGSTHDLGFSLGDSHQPGRKPVILRLEAETAAETTVGSHTLSPGHANHCRDHM